MNDQIVPSGLIDRVKNILLKPDAEWGVIDDEPATIGGIYAKYVLILAAIGPLCGFLHGLLFGYGFFGITYRPSLVGGLTQGIVGYGIALASPFVLSLIIDALAPNFGGTKNPVQAFKVAAYASTASWVAGVFGLIPGLGMLSILGLYSLYLLYLGLPRLMKTPADKAMSYTVVTVVASVILFIVAGALAALVKPHGPGLADSGSVSGTVAIPGLGSLDVGKLEKATKDLEATAAKLKDGGGAPPVDVAKLKALFPEAIGGLARSETASASAGAAGISGSEVSARYGTGAGSIGLKLTDMAALGALAGLGSALNVESSKETADGYEKTGTVDGRMVTEEWRNSDKGGTYRVIVANRFMVEAEGTGTTMDALKGAVSEVGFEKLQALAQ
jgi:Yip1 domain